MLLSSSYQDHINIGGFIMNNPNLERLQKQLASAKTKLILGIVFIVLAEIFSTIGLFILTGGAL
jgi:hypothetical protein